MSADGTIVLPADIVINKIMGQSENLWGYVLSGLYLLARVLTPEHLRTCKISDDPLSSSAVVGSI